jgi:hypothetical protein
MQRRPSNVNTVDDLPEISEEKTLIEDAPDAKDRSHGEMLDTNFRERRRCSRKFAVASSAVYWPCLRLETLQTLVGDVADG